MLKETVSKHFHPYFLFMRYWFSKSFDPIPWIAWVYKLSTSKLKRFVQWNNELGFFNWTSQFTNFDFKPSAVAKTRSGFDSAVSFSPALRHALLLLLLPVSRYGSSALRSLVRLSVDNDTGRSHESSDVTVQIVKILKIMKVRYTRTKLEISCKETHRSRQKKTWKVTEIQHWFHGKTLMFSWYVICSCMLLSCTYNWRMAAIGEALKAK